MGWSNCGNDSQGRPIGYAALATCDHPGCQAQIDRGLAYVCGGMHGESEVSCEKYFCEEHRQDFVESVEGTTRVCSSCANELISSGEWFENEDEGVIQRVKQEL